MTIIARYPGKCAICGNAIAAGEEIEWEKRTKRVTHTQCPPPAATSWRKLAPVERTNRRADYCVTCDHLCAPGTARLIECVSCARNGYEDDSDSMHYHVRCLDDAACAAHVEDAARERAAREEHARRVSEVVREIETRGEIPEYQETRPAGEWLIVEKWTIYGGGASLVVADSHVWYVQNNGMDGDDWSRNNIPTSGAGAIGWRVARTDELVARINALNLAREKRR